MTERSPLHWSRVAALAVVLVLAVVGLLQMNGRADPAPQPEPVLRSPRADLGELDDRKRLTWIASRDRGYFGTRKSLYHSCRVGSPETYYSNGNEAFRQPESEEVLIERHATDRGATAWQAPAWLAPPPPEPGKAAPPPRELPVRQRELDAAEIDAIEAEALALLAMNAPPIRGEMGNDGQGFVLEFCHRGRYGVFAYSNPDPADPVEKHALDLANRILVSGGAKPLEYVVHVALPP
jgi:hypothetical protein